MTGIRALLTAGSALLLLLTPSAFADALQCEAAVDQGHYSRLNSLCIDLPHRDRLEKMRRMMSGDYQHYLGTIRNPSSSFKKLRKAADKGDIDAQFIYAQLLSTVHVANTSNWKRHAANDGSTSMEDYNRVVRKEIRLFTQRAADGGHSLAQLEIAESILLASYTNNDADLTTALQSAGQARRNNPMLADTLIERIKVRMREVEAR